MECISKLAFTAYCNPHNIRPSQGKRPFKQDYEVKICVLGAGALGCAIGGVLTEGGNEVWLVNRGKAASEVLSRHGLTMRENGVDRIVKVHASTDFTEISAATGTMDLIIVLVKSYHTLEAIQTALPIVGAKTMVLSLQNGLGHEDILSQVVGRERVLAGKTYTGGVLLEPGHIIVGTQGKETHIGELDGSLTERSNLIAHTFSSAGLATTVSSNIMGTMWDKLLINVATGALSGITRLRYGDLYQVVEVEACAIAAVAEAIAVAQACGIRLKSSDPRQAWTKAAAGLPYEFKASMLQSLQKGEPTEVDYINGSVVRWGARAGIATPVNQTLVACIKGIERGLPR
jgi:2-dehydropantoate 2-reductase